MSNAPPPPYPGTDTKGGMPPPNPAYPQQPGYGTNQQYPGPGQGAYPPPQQQPYGQPQGQFPQQAPYAPQGQTTVVVQPTPVLVQTFRESPVQTRCPHCQAEVVTGTTFETGTFAWIICVVLCIFGCDLGCCLIPFCVDGCKDVVHNCPNCRQVIARWSRM